MFFCSHKSGHLFRPAREKTGSCESCTCDTNFGAKGEGGGEGVWMINPEKIVHIIKGPLGCLVSLFNIFV